MVWGKLKDFFETKRKGNLEKKIHYKSDGNVSIQVKQLQLERVIQESVKVEDKGTVKTQVKEKEKKKEEKVNSSIFFWIAIAVLSVYIAYREFKTRKPKNKAK